MENSEKSKNLIIPKKEMLELIILSVLVFILPVADILINGLEEPYKQFVFDFQTLKYIYNRIDLFVINSLIPIIFAFVLNLFSSNKLFQNQKLKLIFQIIIGISFILYYTFYCLLSGSVRAIFDHDFSILEEIESIIETLLIFIMPVYAIKKLPAIQQKKKEQILINILIAVITYNILYFPVSYFLNR